MTNISDIESLESVERLLRMRIEGLLEQKKFEENHRDLLNLQEKEVFGHVASLLQLHDMSNEDLAAAIRLAVSESDKHEENQEYIKAHIQRFMLGVYITEREHRMSVLQGNIYVL